MKEIKTAVYLTCNNLEKILQALNNLHLMVGAGEVRPSQGNTVRDEAEQIIEIIKKIKDAKAEVLDKEAAEREKVKLEQAIKKQSAEREAA